MAEINKAININIEYLTEIVQLTDYRTTHKGP